MTTQPTTTNRSKVALTLVLVAAMALSVLAVTTSSADARGDYRESEFRTAIAEQSRDTLGYGTTPAPEVEPKCPRGSIGEPGGCYIFVAPLPNGECPQGSIQDSLGDCRKPVADCPTDGSACSPVWVYQPVAKTT